MGALLKIVGGLVTAFFFSMIALSAMVHAGLMSGYPALPVEAVGKEHFGRSRDVSFEDLLRLADEQEHAFKQRLTLAVNAHMVHFWPNEAPQWTGMQPLHNWPLWLQSHLPGGERLRNFEFVSPRLAWNRGHGFCSQVSRIVYSVLLDHGIHSTIVQHANHVVVDAGGMILDPDFGVVIPHSLDVVQADAAYLVPRYYAGFSERQIEVLTKVYSEGFVPTAPPEQFAARRQLETEAERFKWAGLLLGLWLSVAVLDAGFCWPRFVTFLKSVSPRRAIRSWMPNPAE